MLLAYSLSFVYRIFFLHRFFRQENSISVSFSMTSVSALVDHPLSCPNIKRCYQNKHTREQARLREAAARVFAEEQRLRQEAAERIRVSR